MTPSESTTAHPHATKLWLANVIVFQVGWLVCVLGGNVWAMVFTVPVVIGHLVKYPGWQKDALALAVALVLGLLHDNLLAATGVFVFADSATFSPPWLWCLWALMALTFNHSLKWVYERPWIAAIGGAISGPLAYAGGIALSEVSWGVPFIEGVAILGIVWLFVLPLHRFLTHGIGCLCTRKYSP